MKIDESELQLVITCESREEKKKVFDALVSFREVFYGRKENEQVCLDPRDIFYFESVDKKTFIYTQDDVYESDERLYEIEARQIHFFLRISKSCILNLHKMKSLRADLGGRVLCRLENNEWVSVSRQYAGIFKRKLRGEKDD